MRKFSTHIFIILVMSLFSCSKDNPNEYEFYFDNGGTLIPQNVGPGNITIEFEGKSDLVNKQGGILEFAFENEKAEQIKIDSSEFKPFVLHFSLKGVSQNLRIKFLNDYFNPQKKEDRNVFIRSLKIK